MTKTPYDKLDQLSGQQALPASPDEAVLERVKNPCDEPYMVRLVAPEFTSICPVTGQPDFAHLVVDYCPDKWIVCLLYTSPSPRDRTRSRMPSSA